MTANELIDILQLEAHPKEEGYFRRTYESSIVVGDGAERRPLMTSIFYLLTAGNPTSYLHRNRSDIIHYYHMGAPVHYVTLDESNGLQHHTMGHDLANGQKLQLLVKGGVWKASWIENGAFGLISEAVSPGFDFRDNELATADLLRSRFPGIYPKLQRFIHKS